MKTPRKLAALVLGLAFAAAASAEIYRWTDAAGVTHYTTDINQVPPAQRAGASAPRGAGSLQRVEAKPRPQAVPAALAAPAAASRAPSEDAIEGKSESEWRSEAERLRKRVAFYEPIAERCQGDTLRISARSDGDQIREEREEAEACERSRAELESATRQLADFEERAHRAGVPPGWIRE
jgi:hypothetical protein